MEVLAAVERFGADLERIGAEPPPQPRWSQDWFPRLDAAAAYAIVRLTRPPRIVEVGSGHSTRFLARAVADGGFACDIASIDPAPRAALDGLPLRSFRVRVQEAPLALFIALAPGDILFIDSSHQVKPGSDVAHLFAQVLPELKSGVRVHFHDIFLPDAYPEHWGWRRYNEQEAVAGLLASGDYVEEFSSRKALKQGLEGVLGQLPLALGALESSLWLRKR